MGDYNEIYFNVWDDRTEKKQYTQGYVESDESEEEQDAIAKLVVETGSTPIWNCRLT